MVRLFRGMLTELGAFTAHPLAFVIVGIYALAWATFDRASLDWHGAATLATWFMTLLIQRAEHRDTQAIHAKLDELLRADANASSELAKVDQKEPEEIEQQRGKK
jgi:low affinity Fe/Cu permease